MNILSTPNLLFPKSQNLQLYVGKFQLRASTQPFSPCLHTKHETVNSHTNTPTKTESVDSTSSAFVWPTHKDMLSWCKLLMSCQRRCPISLHDTDRHIRTHTHITTWTDVHITGAVNITADIHGSALYNSCAQYSSAGRRVSQRHRQWQCTKVNESLIESYYTLCPEMML